MVGYKIQVWILVLTNRKNSRKQGVLSKNKWAEELIHPPNKLIDEILTITGITTFNIVIPLLLQTTQRGTKLERPEEVVSLLKVRPNGQDLVNKIFNADNTMFTKNLTIESPGISKKIQRVQLIVNKSMEEYKNLFDDWVVCQSNALLVDLTEPPLVYQFSDTLQVGVPESESKWIQIDEQPKFFLRGRNI